MKEASNLLLELVNDVLDMSKLESGEIVLEEIPFNLSSISREVFIVIEQMAAEQNIRIVWEKKEIIHRDLIGSPMYVKRVMMNIICIMVCHIDHASDSIDRSPDIMAHTLQTRESLLPATMRACWGRIRLTTKLFRQ